ncbi:hypothetical protein CEX98_02975 [Pseudoalteromonas piscicida]|uniref:Uncharacterized protein n=1 Tax=Pseudoalteromonas piscicida TaxID=43662 RepID=A0A2A5JUT4_PSEO7|nr:hypothetical protein CEX98_02975 [Pseudoalteromonas piscicida]
MIYLEASKASQQLGETLYLAVIEKVFIRPVPNLLPQIALELRQNDISALPFWRGISKCRNIAADFNGDLR